MKGFIFDEGCHVMIENKYKYQHIRSTPFERLVRSCKVNLGKVGLGKFRFLNCVDIN